MAAAIVIRTVAVVGTVFNICVVGVSVYIVFDVINAVVTIFVVGSAVFVSFKDFVVVDVDMLIVLVGSIVVVFALNLIFIGPVAVFEADLLLCLVDVGVLGGIVVIVDVVVVVSSHSFTSQFSSIYSSRLAFCHLRVFASCRFSELLERSLVSLPMTLSAIRGVSSKTLRRSCNFVRRVMSASPRHVGVHCAVAG